MFFAWPLLESAWPLPQVHLAMHRAVGTMSFTRAPIA
jgi:hypothetical protein